MGREGQACSGDLFPPLPLWPKKEGLGDLSFSVHFLPSFSLRFLFRWLYSFSSNVSAIFLQLYSYLPLDTVPPGLGPPFSPNLETGAPDPGLRALHASRVGVCAHVALSLSAFQVSVRDLLSALLQDDGAAAERGGTQ